MKTGRWVGRLSLLTGIFVGMGVGATGLAVGEELGLGEGCMLGDDVG